jgi:hypothetical protein
MTMTDLDARADRVRQIAHTLYGRVLDRNRNKMVIEVPADLLGAAMNMLSMGGFGMPDGVGKQTSRMATKRITGMSGQIVVCQGHEELMAFFSINVSLKTRDVRVENPDTPHSGAVWLTRPTKPAV